MPPDEDILRQEINHTWLLRLLLILASCLALASALPGPLVLPALSSTLTLLACVSTLLAAVAREPVAGGHLTRWDQSAVLLALSFPTGWAADPIAAARALQMLETGVAAAS